MNNLISLTSSTVTPIDEISQLQISSRPVVKVVRKKQLRAIPVFSWTQSRFLLPLGMVSAQLWQEFVSQSRNT